jgi:hypothetical protein
LRRPEPDGLGDVRWRVRGGRSGEGRATKSPPPPGLAQGEVDVGIVFALQVREPGGKDSNPGRGFSGGKIAGGPRPTPVGSMA